MDLKYPVHACHANESNQADNLYQILQSSASFPPEVYIAPAKSALLWETSSFDCSDEEIKVKISTILLKVNDEDEIYSVVQVDPNDTAIKEFIESDSTTAKKSAAMTAKISTTSEDEEEAAPVPRPKRKAETKEIEEKILKRTEVTRNKQAEKAMVESTEKGASKKARSRSRSKSIVEGKDGGNSTPTLKAPAARKESKDSIAESIASKGPQTTKKRKRQIRDPNSPRRPLTTFLLFCKDAREGIKKEHPDATAPGLGKILLAKYEQLSSMEKEVYGSQAAALKKQFDLDKVEYSKHDEKEDLESVDSVELESKSSTKRNNPKQMTITKETEDAKAKGDSIKTPTKAATVKGSEGEEEKGDTTKKTKKTTKKNKDPNAPRRPLTTYMLFCKDVREGIKKEHPDATVPEMGKILGAKYTELSGVEKEVYRSQAITLKKHFDLDKAQYLKDKDKEAQAEEDNTESLDSVEIESKPSSKKKHPKKRTITKETEDAEEIGDTVRSPTKAAIKVTKSEEEKRDPTKKTKKTRKKDKDPNAPKRPLTTYLLFCKEYREKVVKENPDKTTQEIGMILGATYRKLKTEERAKYQKDADKLKQQFLKDEENYETNTVEGGSDGGDKSDEEEEAPETVKKNKRAKKDPIAPKKAQSAYVLFCSSKRPKLKEEQPKLTVPETARIMGKMWQDTSAAMKAPFDVMAKKDKERYKSEMETFKASS